MENFSKITIKQNRPFHRVVSPPLQPWWRGSKCAFWPLVYNPTNYFLPVRENHIYIRTHTQLYKAGKNSLMHLASSWETSLLFMEKSKCSFLEESWTSVFLLAFLLSAFKRHLITDAIMMNSKKVGCFSCQKLHNERKKYMSCREDTAFCLNSSLINNWF